MIETLIYVAVAMIAVGIPVVYIWSEHRKSAHATRVLQKSVERGMDEPVSLHPVIDPNICIGSGACVNACPEKDVLGLIGNRSRLINPTHCVGHGMCQAACPVNAITLVFGTENRGVDIPFLKGNFETNVPGIFIAGELGGMGFIRNAVAQGRQAVENIARSIEKRKIEGVADLAIVGAGPAGISGSLQALQEGLVCITLDQEDLGGTVLTYPRRKLVMTHPVVLPIYGEIKSRDILKEQLLKIFQDVFSQTGLTIQSGVKVEEIVREDGQFKLTTNRGEYRAQRVLLAIGRRGSPRKLGVPGEKSGKVSYRLLDPERFQNMRILVVGGGDSAVEAALALAEQPGNTVHLSYRNPSLYRIKEGNLLRFEQAASQGSVTPFFNSSVVEILPDKVLMLLDGKEHALANDYVFVFIGGELPSQFLQKVGIEVDRKFGQK